MFNLGKRQNSSIILIKVDRSPKKRKLNKHSLTGICFLFFTSVAFSQIGVGTSTPDNSAMLEVSATDRGFLLPRMTTVQRISISAPATGLQVFDSNTNSIWYYNGTYWVNTQAMATEGDVKSGIQIADHSGWVLLDGRPLTSLSANQQAVAASLGLAVNLPDATDAYLVQNGGGMGAVSGSNATTLVQANLPNVNFTGTAASAGDHNHVTDPVASTTTSGGDHAHTGNTSTNGSHIHPVGRSTLGGWPAGEPTAFKMNMTGFNEPDVATTDRGANVGYSNTGIIGSEGNHNHTLNINNSGSHTHTVDIPATTSTTAGTHTHSVSIASGGSSTPINITPKSLTVNMFIYLGL